MSSCWDKDSMFSEMELLKGAVLNTSRVLARYNRDDTAYQELLELAKREYFFETYQVVAWCGLRLQPKRILEIGTRIGGSLVQLLSMLDGYAGVEAVCFDLWREIGSPRRVKKNLRVMNIPTSFVRFVSGDSKATVPDFFRKRSDAMFDYVLVDGGHDRETAATDLENVADHVARDGVLIFDDIGPESYKLDDVWQEFKKRQGARFQYYEKYWRKGVAWAFHAGG